MPEPGAERPEVRGYWDSIDGRHRRNIALAVALTVLVLVAGAVALVLITARTPERRIGGGAKVVGGPAADLPTASVSPTAATSPTQSVSTGATSSAGTSATPAFTRAAKLAYRKDGWLWVAAEDGSGARKLVAAAAGSFALSPDAGTLAYEDAGHALRLLQVAGDAGTAVQPMMAGARISWAPSSEWLVYQGASGEGRRVTRDGSGDREVGRGDAFAVAPDAKRLGYVVRATGGRSAALLFAEPDRSPDASGMPGVADPLAFAWLDSRRIAYISRESAGTAEYGVYAAVLFSGAPVKVAGDPLDERALPAGMCASSDGRHVSWADQGDDGYSRTWMLDVTTGVVVPASKRYDTYPLCWSADGTRLFLIEGNAWQGESTRLISLPADGTDERVIVEGAVP